MFAAAVLLFLETGDYLRVYQTTFLQEPLSEWQAGMGKAIKLAESNRRDSDTITIIGDTHYTYIYPLFYLSLSADTLKKTAELYPADTLGFSRVNSYSHFRFVETRDQAERPTILIEQQGSMFITEKID